MPPRPPLRVLIAVALVAGCTLALQVALTRVFSAALFYHFGFLAISLALVGTGAAAMLIYLRPRWFEAPARAGSLGAWCAALTVSLLVVPALLVRLNYTSNSSITLRFALTLALASLLSALPFFAAGMVITLSITRYTRWIHRVYASDLLGAGLGAVAVVPALWQVPAPLLLAAIGLVAAAAVLLCAESRAGRRAAMGVTALAAAAVGLGAATSLYHLPPALKGDPVADRWTPLSRVVGYRTTGGRSFGVLTYDRDYAPVPRYLRGQPLPDWRSLELGPQSVGFASAPRGRVLVIGGGGGRDIYNALSSGEPRVDVIELNQAIVHVVDRDLGAAFGSPYTLPGVHVRIGDGRSTLAAGHTRYQEINVGFTNTLSGNAAQGYALTENNLYTIEAFEEYFDHLAPGGILSVSRIYRLVGDEALRATVLTLAALQHRGIRHPERNVVVLLGHDLLTGKLFGTVLAQLSPFTAPQLARIRQLAGAAHPGRRLRPRRTLLRRVGPARAGAEPGRVLLRLPRRRLSLHRRQAVLLELRAAEHHRPAHAAGVPVQRQAVHGAAGRAGDPRRAVRARVRTPARARGPRGPPADGIARLLRRHRRRLPGAGGDA